MNVTSNDELLLTYGGGCLVPCIYYEFYKDLQVLYGFHV
jgi:hypothetical protein